MRFVSEASWFDFKFFFCTFCLVLCEHECPFSSSSSSLPLLHSLSPSLTISLMHTLSLKVIHSLKYILCLCMSLLSSKSCLSLCLCLPLLHNLSIYLFACSHIIFLFHTYLHSFLYSSFFLSLYLSLIHFLFISPIFSFLHYLLFHNLFFPFPL